MLQECNCDSSTSNSDPAQSTQRPRGQDCCWARIVDDSDRTPRESSDFRIAVIGPESRVSRICDTHNYDMMILVLKRVTLPLFDSEQFFQ